MNKNNKIQRQTRIRKKFRLITDRVRLSVFRSNKHLYAQIIDDKAGKTLVSVMDKSLAEKVTGVEKAKKLGLKLAELAKEKKISTVVFDKGSYTYHGKIKAIAEGAREGGLQF
jgi:large subunit ribosomal protein L18